MQRNVFTISEMTELGVLNFTQNAYSGSLKEGVLIVEDIILEYGYTPQTTFILSGGNYFFSMQVIKTVYDLQTSCYNICNKFISYIYKDVQYNR